jgi:hypothetical protein
MSLDDKGSNWQSWVIKGIVFFAVIGSIMLYIAGQLVKNTISDITNSSSSTNQPATTSTTSNNGRSAGEPTAK